MTVRTFLLPDLGEGLTDAELVSWLVAEGDMVGIDQPVAEVETAKSLVEVPSPFAGRVAQLHGRVGESVDVGRPLISVEIVPVPATAGEVYREEEKAGSGNVLIGYGTPQNGHAPRRARAPRSTPAQKTPPRSSPPAAVAASAGMGHGAAVPVVPVAPAVPAVPVVPAVRAEAPRCVSPLVRRLAREAGLMLADIAGTGPDGLILRRDVLAAMAPVADPAQAVGTQDAGENRDPRTGLDVTSRTPVRGLRRTIAGNLSRSRSLIPEATVWVDVDATALMDLRADLAKQRSDVPSLLAFLARFTLAGLARFPELNTRFVPGPGGSEDGSRETGSQGTDPQKQSGARDAVIETFDGINLGIAVQGERGLMVPAVRRADSLSTRDLDTEIRRLATAARAGRATPAELSSGTFTLNNYGVYGVDGSAAIINYPESAILGVGRIIEKPWVVSGQLAVRQLTQLTLVFDHRVCDGATAGGFLRYVADAVENPARVLADL